MMSFELEERDNVGQLPTLNPLIARAPGGGRRTPSIPNSRRSILSFVPDRVPHPSHRHAAPSAPWPWVDLDDKIDQVQLGKDTPPIPPLCDHTPENCKDGCWKGYPQSRFPNWTREQVKKSKIKSALDIEAECKVLVVDVNKEGFFSADPEHTITAKVGDDNSVWQAMIHENRKEGTRLRAYFIENLSGPILRMFGAKYNIEPFFWSSSLNWIPSRFQEEIQDRIGDHITISLTFLRCMPLDHEAKQKYDSVFRNDALSSDNKGSNPSLGTQRIDPHLPLLLRDSVLTLDLLSIHLIRHVNGSSIISYHPNFNFPTTTAAFLHERIRFAGQSVYWQNIFQKSPDPTFVLLTYVWHALYAWDEALEKLYAHICYLEARVIQTTDLALTRELHIIRAHHLHYASLLNEFTKHIDFIRDTENPSLQDMSKEDKDYNDLIMKRECENLVAESQRLRDELAMQEKRLKNVIDLVFSTVNISDSKLMREMTEASIQDSAGRSTICFHMKQIAYLTMVFLPASFMAGFFGMNIGALNPGTQGTFPHYVAASLTLTGLTIWIIVAFQSKDSFPPDTPFRKRLTWPVYMPYQKLTKKNSQKTKENHRMQRMETESVSSDKSEFGFNIENVDVREV